VTVCNASGNTIVHGRENLIQTDSEGLNLKVELSIKKIFSAAIEFTYHHDRTTEKEAGQDIEVHLKSFRKYWVAGTAPVIRDIGTFTLQLGNTEWIIKDVYFDSPDPNPEHFGNYVIDSRELNALEKATECTGKEPNKGIVPGDPADVQIANVGDDGANFLRGWAESNTIRGLGGDDLILGGSGHDTLYGGGGDDTINGGPGEDTLSGGPGADRITDRSGPTVVYTGGNSGPGNDVVDVRDGKGDDVVHCETTSTVVIADPGDEIDGSCGKVILGTQVIGS
jgi:hypothetical protein